LLKDQQDSLYTQIGSLIKAQRIKLSISQDDLAKDLGFVSRISIAHIENGKQKIQLHTLLEICELFKVPVTTLLPPIDSLKQQISAQIVKKIDREATESEAEKIKGFYRYSKNSLHKK
jgi:transcriptional regulator with XRE-family HTH domain